MPAPLETDRLLLRPFAADDAPRLVALDADPQVTKHVYVGPYGPPPPDRYEADVLPRFTADFGDPALGFWRVHLKEEEGEPFAGWVVFRPVGVAKWFPDAAAASDGLALPPETPELGYRLARRFWGRGFATEAARAVSAGRGPAVAIRQLANAASGRVLEKCGLPQVRPLSLPGVTAPTVMHRRLD